MSGHSSGPVLGRRSERGAGRPGLQPGQCGSGRCPVQSSLGSDVGGRPGYRHQALRRGIFTWLIKREPILATAAYIVVFNIGVELLLAEFFHMHFEAWQKFAISLSTLLLCVLYARLKFLHGLAPVFRWAGQGMGLMNDLIDWAFAPLVAIIKLIVGNITAGVRHLSSPAGGQPALPETQTNWQPDAYSPSTQTEQEA